MATKSRYSNRPVIAQSVIDTIRPYYNAIRPYLPRKTGSRQGVIYRGAKLFDLSLRHNPHWKAPFVDLLYEHTDCGDTTIHVGGGWGIGPVISARFGDVTVYEAARKYADRCRETARLNGVAEKVSVTNAIVAKPGEVWGSSDGAMVVDPAELPTADILVLDCEGAELDIISDLENPPTTVIVESGIGPHAPVETVTDALEGIGYSIETIRRDGQAGWVVGTR